MKLQATTSILIPQGAFSAGQVFETSAEIAERLLAKGHAQEPVEAIETRDPAIESRDPKNTKRKAK
jgi:hypothetical protein